MRSVRAAALCWVVSGLGLAACRNHAQRSITLYEAGDYPGAARVADAELADHPGDDRLWQMRVRAALAQGDAAGVATSYAAYRTRRGDDDRPLVRELAVATLGQGLAAGTPWRVRVAAIEAVAASELEDLAERVAEQMADDDDRVVAASAIAVLRGFPGAANAAGDMLRSEEPEARRIAVDGIGRKVGAPALGDLRAAARDPDPQVRRAAIRWLGQLRDAGAVELLTRHLRDPDDAARAGAASALARIGAQGGANLVELGQQAVRDRALAVRLAGIELWVAAGTAGQAALDALVEDPHPMVAAEAAIARKNAAAAARAIERAAGSDDWAVRAGAANIAVRGAGVPAALAVAKKLTGDAEGRVRLAAARVLVHHGDRATARTVFAAELATDLRVEAAVDLALDGDPRGVQALDAAVRDRAQSPDARLAAAAAHRSARQITPGLVAALADRSAAVRVEAAGVLAQLSADD